MNKFEDGLEHVKSRISRIEDEIYTTTESIERNVSDEEKLQDRILEISGIEQILSELYDELYRISDFHESNNALILEGFEVKLRKIYKDYYSNKISCLMGEGPLEYDKIYGIYQSSRSTLINELKRSCGGNFLNVGTLNDVITRLLESNKEVFRSIFKVESLYRILQCFINVDFLLWDPFSGSEGGVTLPSISAIINGALKQSGEKFSNYELFARDKLLERLYSDKLADYLCEVVQRYWTPTYFKETESLVKSLSCILVDFKIDFSQVTAGLVNGLEDSFNFLLYECLPKPNFEYKFALLLLNWSISARLITVTFKAEQECIKAILSKSIVQLPQRIRNHKNEKLRKLFCSTELDVEDIINNSVYQEGANSLNMASTTQQNTEAAGLQSVNQVIHKITNSYKLEFLNKKYVLIDVIMEIVSN